MLTLKFTVKCSKSRTGIRLAFGIRDHITEAKLELKYTPCVEGVCCLTTKRLTNLIQNLYSKSCRVTTLHLSLHRHQRRPSSTSVQAQAQVPLNEYPHIVETSASLPHPSGHQSDWIDTELSEGIDPGVRWYRFCIVADLVGNGELKTVFKEWKTEDGISIFQR